MNLYAFPVTCPFKLFSLSLYVRNYHEDVAVLVAVMVGRPIYTLGHQPLQNSHTGCLYHTSRQGQCNQQSINKEWEHIRMALHNCHFPTWALNKLQQHFQYRQHNSNEPNSTYNQTPTTTITMGPTITATRIATSSW